MAFDKPINVYTDNMGAVALSDNPVFHNQSKHIDIKWHFIWDLIWSKSSTLHTSLAPSMEQTFLQGT